MGGDFSYNVRFLIGPHAAIVPRPGANRRKINENSSKLIQEQCGCIFLHGCAYAEWVAHFFLSFPLYDDNKLINKKNNW